MLGEEEMTSLKVLLKTIYGKAVTENPQEYSLEYGTAVTFY